MYLSARHLSACLFHVSARGAIMAAASANSRRLSQQNPYKTCVSLVELGQTSRHFSVHFEKIPTKIILRYGRCARNIPAESFRFSCFHVLLVALRSVLRIGKMGNATGNYILIFNFLSIKAFSYVHLHH